MKVQRIIRRLALALVGMTFISIVFSGCYYDNEQQLYQYYYTNNQCDTSNVTFSQTIFPVIQATCAISGCLVAGGTGNGIYDNYAGVKEKVDNGSFLARVIQQRNMPPGAPLTDCQINQMRVWLNAGAPNN